MKSSEDRIQGDSRTLELGFTEAAPALTGAESRGVPVLTPAPASLPDLTNEERAVYGELYRRGRGRANAIGLDVLAALAGIGERVVQHVIAHLIERHQLPIGSAVKRPMGYFLIETEDERAEALAQLAHRLTALARRIAALKASTTPIVLKQMAIELEAEAA